MQSFLEAAATRSEDASARTPTRTVVFGGAASQLSMSLCIRFDRNGASVGMIGCPVCALLSNEQLARPSASAEMAIAEENYDCDSDDAYEPPLMRGVSEEERFEATQAKNKAGRRGGKKGASSGRTKGLGAAPAARPGGRGQRSGVVSARDAKRREAIAELVAERRAKAAARVWAAPMARFAAEETTFAWAPGAAPWVPGATRLAADQQASSEYR